MLSVKAIAGASIIAGNLALAAFGIAPAANAAPPAPVISGPQWLAENGPGRGHGHDRHDDWRWDDGPRRWDPIDACVRAEGPFGYVEGSLCI
jgi:hypothetical protein